MPNWTGDSQSIVPPKPPSLILIVATSVVGVIKFQQVPNFYTLIGLILIISGVLLVNLLGNK